jgi:nucleotide-binding universal stress UspA family protein
MYKRILAPIDGSPPSMAGVAHAVRLAKDQQASLNFLHIVHDYVVADGRHGIVRYAELLKDLHEQGERILADAVAVARNDDVPAEGTILELPMGEVGAEIAAYADRWNADLIVIGTHGRRGIRRLVMGSDAEYVVRTTTRPVLLISSRDDRKGPGGDGRRGALQAGQ